VASQWGIELEKRTECVLDKEGQCGVSHVVSYRCLLSVKSRLPENCQCDQVRQGLS
jgi:hypothetical protein